MFQSSAAQRGEWQTTQQHTIISHYVAHDIRYNESKKYNVSSEIQHVVFKVKLSNAM